MIPRPYKDLLGEEAARIIRTRVGGDVPPLLQALGLNLAEIGCPVLANCPR